MMEERSKAVLVVYLALVLDNILLTVVGNKSLFVALIVIKIENRSLCLTCILENQKMKIIALNNIIPVEQASLDE